MTLTNASRRKFLRTASVVSGSVGAAAAPFALNLATLGTASAQTSGPYKAIVCMFLYGGNDSSHMVFRTDKTSFDVYTKMRSSAPESIALLAPGTPAVGNATLASPARLGGIRAITPKFSAAVGGSTENKPLAFGVHPSMGEVADLFAADRLAIVANAGPLIAPMTKAQYQANSVPRPRALGSHNDQQSTWQALGPEGVKIGWGGRLGDMMASSNTNATFTSVAISGNAVFSAGDTVFQYQVGSGGATSIGGLTGNLFNSSTAAATLKGIVTASNQNLFADEYSSIVKRSVAAQASFQTAFNSTVAAAPNPGNYIQPSLNQARANDLAKQLQTVARIIAARGALGTNRQVFFVSMGGFDTHSSQNANGADLYARISHAIGYFDEVMGNMGMRDSVTLFTASDFGRDLRSNGDGTDHGWGGHHFVAGGAVKGGEIYGRFPEFGPQGIDTINGNSFLPVNSVDQIGATLGKWFGASASQLETVFPNLKNFSTPDLGFLG